MRSACTVLLALAAAALCSAEPDPHRPRQDSNLEICILPLLVDFKVSNVPIPTQTLCLPDLLASDKRLFETKRKDQLNALKNLVELNDINQQYKIIDIMLKGLFKVGVRESWQRRKGPLYFSARELFFLVAVKSPPWVGGMALNANRKSSDIFGRCLGCEGQRLGMLAARQREWEARDPTNLCV